MGMVESLKQVFGATGEYRQTLPSEVRIGGSVLMISDAGSAIVEIDVNPLMVHARGQGATALDALIVAE
jgi:hypothetical protein